MPSNGIVTLEVFVRKEIDRWCINTHENDPSSRQCIHELTGQPLLDPATVPDDMTQGDVRLVGNYAIAIQFSDGHDTGIYTFDHLRRAGDAASS